MILLVASSYLITTQLSYLSKITLDHTRTNCKIYRGFNVYTNVFINIKCSSTVRKVECFKLGATVFTKNENSLPFYKSS